MIAAIYAPKSTGQYGVADEPKSIARQVEQAFAAAKGWTVDDALVFVDDGISGAEFAARPGFLRLMNALKPRPTFQVLIMAEESRLSREAIETAYALKRMITAGCASGTSSTRRHDSASCSRVSLSSRPRGSVRRTRRSSTQKTSWTATTAVSSNARMEKR